MTKENINHPIGPVGMDLLIETLFSLGMKYQRLRSEGNSTAATQIWDRKQATKKTMLDVMYKSGEARDIVLSMPQTEETSV